MANSSRQEILNSGGLRADNRRPLTLRPFSLAVSPTSVQLPYALTSTAPSSYSTGTTSTCSHGLTTVLSTVLGPKEMKRGNSLPDRAVVSVDVGVAAWAGTERRKRGKSDRRIQDLALLLKQTFEPVILTHLYPRSEIAIYIQVLSMDGALLQAAINATTLALQTSGISLLSPLLSLSIGLHLTQPLLDLTATEESSLPHLVLAVLPNTGKITLAHMESRIGIDRFEEMLEVGGKAVAVLEAEMQRCVMKWAEGIKGRMERGSLAGTDEKTILRHEDDDMMDEDY